MRKLPPILFALALAAGCVHVPPEVKAEFAPADGRRPNHYHGTCEPCAKARAEARAGRGAWPKTCANRPEARS